MKASVGPQSVDVIYKSEKSLAQAIEKRARMYEKAMKKFKKDASEKTLKCLKELKEALMRIKKFKHLKSIILKRPTNGDLIAYM